MAAGQALAEIPDPSSAASKPGAARPASSVFSKQMETSKNTSLRAKRSNLCLVRPCNPGLPHPLCGFALTIIRLFELSKCFSAALSSTAAASSFFSRRCQEIGSDNMIRVQDQQAIEPTGQSKSKRRILGPLAFNPPLDVAHSDTLRNTSLVRCASIRRPRLDYGWACRAPREPPDIRNEHCGHGDPACRTADHPAASSAATD
jgi:hypothetical protein